jgi:hypothetical protein
MRCLAALQPGELDRRRPRPAIKDDVMKAVTPSVQKAINGMVADYMPFPSACGG